MTRLLAMAAAMTLAAACSDPGDPATGEPDAGSAGGFADANGTGNPIDAAPQPEAPFGLVTCQDEIAGDAGASVGPQSCCDPYGVCPALEACIEGPDSERLCRPTCDPDGVDDCPDGMRCARFDDTGACIPAAAEGRDCSPEPCDSATICVGDSADDATCHRRCGDVSDCDDGQVCAELFGSDSHACMDGSSY